MSQTLTHTPAWVFVLFAVLIALGLIQTRDRWVRQQQAYLLPVVMIVLSFLGMLASVGMHALTISAWLAGLVVLALAARRAFLRSILSFDYQRKQFFIPGSWTPMVVIMLIFFTKYALAADKAISGTPIKPETALGVSLLLGACSGYFVARSVALAEVARRPRICRKNC